MGRPLGREFAQQVCVNVDDKTYDTLRDKVFAQQIPISQYIRSLILKELRKEAEEAAA